MTVALIIIGWLACGTANYFIFRWFMVNPPYPMVWTVSLRYRGIGYSLFGPINVPCWLIFLAAYFLDKSTIDWNRPAKW